MLAVVMVRVIAQTSFSMFAVADKSGIYVIDRAGRPSRSCLFFFFSSNESLFILWAGQ